MIESRFDPARKIAGEIQLTLIEHPPEVQAVILAQLIGAFISSYVIEDDPGATITMRGKILHELLDTAQALVNSADEYRDAGHA